MKRIDIDPARLRLPAVSAWMDRWFLLAAGDLPSGSYNVMTVAWGALGCMWKRPLAMIVVRPTRYTYTFFQKHRDFTLNRFPPEFEDTLNYCGSHSGRDVDKIRQTGLTPIPCRRVAAPGFQQAELILECRVSYFNDLDPSRFLENYIEDNYPNKDYHRMFFGEILAASGTADYQD